ncbi:TIGR02391 family protein [Streptomyces sp. BE303]|uniref:TIGR02391 family protein n=1 Tax=Streptomyces sp. BE303 TaxID=3002528 RepID=UPI003FA706C1
MYCDGTREAREKLGGDTYRSGHRSAAAFAKGCFAAIRNPDSHEANLPELPEREALEQRLSQRAGPVSGPATSEA